MAKSNKSIKQLEELNDLLNDKSGNLQDNLQRAAEAAKVLDAALKGMEANASAKALGATKIGVAKMARELDAYANAADKVTATTQKLARSIDLDNASDNMLRQLNIILAMSKRVGDSFSSLRNNITALEKAKIPVSTQQPGVSIKAPSNPKKLAAIDKMLDIGGTDGPEKKLDNIRVAIKLINTEIKALGKAALPTALGASTEGLDSIISDMKHLEEAQGKVTASIGLLRSQYSTLMQEGGALHSKLAAVEDANYGMLQSRIDASVKVNTAVDQLQVRNKLTEEQSAILAKHFGDDVTRMSKYNALLQTQVNLRGMIKELSISRANDPEHVTFGSHMQGEGYDLKEIEKTIDAFSSMGDETFTTAQKIRTLKKELDILASSGHNLDVPMSGVAGTETLRQQSFRTLLDVEAKNVPTAESFERTAKQANILLSEMTAWTNDLKDSGSDNVKYLTERILQLRDSLKEVNQAVKNFDF